MENNHFDYDGSLLLRLIQIDIGYEVPLIEKDIEFLQKLADEIAGVDYLEHKLYLKEWISDKKQYKQKVLKREYMKNFEYN